MSNTKSVVGGVLVGVFIWACVVELMGAEADATTGAEASASVVSSSRAALAMRFSLEHAVVRVRVTTARATPRTMERMYGLLGRTLW